MSNPNNCATCKNRQYRDDGDGGIGHCYMFRAEPDFPCPHHSWHGEQVKAMRRLMARAVLSKIEGRKP